MEWRLYNNWLCQSPAVRCKWLAALDLYLQPGSELGPRTAKAYKSFTRVGLKSWSVAGLLELLLYEPSRSWIMNVRIISKPIRLDPSIHREIQWTRKSRKAPQVDSFYLSPMWSSRHGAPVSASAPILCASRSNPCQLYRKSVTEMIKVKKVSTYLAILQNIIMGFRWQIFFIEGLCVQYARLYISVCYDWHFLASETRKCPAAVDCVRDDDTRLELRESKKPTGPEQERRELPNYQRSWFI